MQEVIGYLEEFTLGEQCHRAELSAARPKTGIKREPTDKSMNEETPIPSDFHIMLSYRLSLRRFDRMWREMDFGTRRHMGGRCWMAPVCCNASNRRH